MCRTAGTLSWGALQLSSRATRGRAPRRALTAHPPLQAPTTSARCSSVTATAQPPCASPRHRITALTSTWTRRNTAAVKCGAAAANKTLAPRASTRPCCAAAPRQGGREGDRGRVEAKPRPFHHPRPLIGPERRRGRGQEEARAASAWRRIPVGRYPAALGRRSGRSSRGRRRSRPSAGRGRRAAALRRSASPLLVALRIPRGAAVCGAEASVGRRPLRAARVRAGLRG